MGELYWHLRNYLDRERVAYAFVAPVDVVFSQRRALQPDISVMPLVIDVAAYFSAVLDG